MRDFTTDIADVARRVKEAEAYLKVPGMRTRLSELEVEIAKPDLWNDQENAKRVNSEYASVKGDLDEFDQIARTLDDVQVLHEMAREVDDASQEPEIEQNLARARAALDEVELRSLFIGEHDEADAIVQINAKDGGVDAQDWSAMLLRMFTRWAERRNFAVEMGDVSDGTEAGILSADFTVRGRYTSMSMSASLISTSTSSSTGHTCTVAKLVCRRPWLSNGLMRTRRCVPRSLVSRP